MNELKAILRVKHLALLALGLLAALAPLSLVGAQGYPLPPKVKTIATTPNGLPTGNALPNTLVTISTQLSDASDHPLVNAGVTFTITSAPAGSDAAFAPKTASTLDPSTAAGRQLLTSLLGATSINVKTDQAGTAKAQLNTGGAQGDLIITTSVGGTVVGTTKLSVGTAAPPLPPSTGSGFVAGSDPVWYLLPGALALVVLMTVALTRRRRLR